MCSLLAGGVLSILIGIGGPLFPEITLDQLESLRPVMSDTLGGSVVCYFPETAISGVSPKNAASQSRLRRIQILNDPMAENAPAANRRESPGRNGVNTKPVSANKIMNKIAYAKVP